MPEHSMQADLRRFTREHGELAARIDGLREWITEISELGIPHFGEMGDRLQPLYTELCEHFAHEEAHNFLAEAIALLPDYTDGAEDLRLQHAPLLSRMDALICQLHEDERPFASWQRACKELDAILAALASHEHLEMEILAAAARVEAAGSQGHSTGESTDTSD